VLINCLFSVWQEEEIRLLRG